MCCIELTRGAAARINDVPPPASQNLVKGEEPEAERCVYENKEN
jgi:hypothetical protein